MNLARQIDVRSYPVTGEPQASPEEKKQAMNNQKSMTELFIRSEPCYVTAFDW